ncbi:malto-oligosyltrehalose synthase [Pedobacter sp. SYSU D00535]|uniref:malto-oligosyltrehalose synthase n=1 Tax=Pedobacter sp. SYSU D00535 TaxID=2810308 RepID=UPI001A97AB05|nr:malto-oligosyltrehalose synthase [Pedobacter sp. SYSU D00535]
MHNPVATYRLQFHKEFTFDEFESIVPYLKKLGVSTIYASPIFQSTPGSTHGYDALNPHLINPEIGSEEQLKRLRTELDEDNIGWLQDIVPNHMAFHSQNPWLMDVLEKGRQSTFAEFFDIGWESPLHGGRVMVPFLGSSLEEVVNNGELKIEYQGQRFVLKYYDSAYPLNPKTYQKIFAGGQAPVQALEQLLQQMHRAHQVEDPKIYKERWDEVLLQLTSLMKNDAVRSAIDRNVEQLNSSKEDLLEIAREQNYQLCHWQETDKQINFRRFFTVNSLICLNIQNEDVFKYFHTYIKELVDQGIFQGLRIDHVDGLYDPTRYLQDLRKLVGEDTYVVVEKILEPGEDIPKRWPIQGNTGYDFLSVVNNLLTNNENEKLFTKFYQKLVDEKNSVHQQIHDKKAHILNEHMQGELDNLYQLFVKQQLVEELDVDTATFKQAIGEVLIQCPVYRYYGNSLPLDKEEEEALLDIFKRIRKSKTGLSAAIDTLEDVIVRKTKEGNEEYNQKALHFYQRLMQFSGPLMAKGVEDTLMYTYNRFVGHNEVGDSPEAFGHTIEEFHQRMIDRQENWPLSINATSTHDTKRGEDVRARLNVLTDIADEWLEAVKLWQYLNASQKQENAPDANDEYLIYQNLIGAWPMPGQDEDNFKNRIQDYIEKALREAKQHSNWTSPDQQYEEAAKNFAAGLLDPDKQFWKHFRPLHKKVADFGIVNSLIQVLLKFTSPGVPDVYQGCELYDLSLVDPDNRRPVDYQKREQWLTELEAFRQDRRALLENLWENRYDGKIKLWLTNLLFNERKAEKDVFEKAAYIPLKVKGKYKDQILAFARHHQQTWYVVIVPLHLASISKEQKKDILDLKWKETRVVLPENVPVVFENVLTKERGKVEGEILVKDLFDKAPLALLKLKQPVNERGAGILLHITSLPSAFGIGDMGPEAKRFADFLVSMKQKYWQILPLSPTEAGQGYSPYSAISSMAGNTLLISPELLVDEGLLEKKDLKDFRLPVKDKANFKAAEKQKDILFEVAFNTFKKGAFSSLATEFEAFCAKEASWLNNYALYIGLKLQHGGRPWYEWPEHFRLRDKTELERFSSQHAATLEKTMFLQFLFMKQWKALRSYCNKLGIKIFGDLPFYVSYDSADVWSRPELFKLDENGKQIGTSGVPPDYFNENGQLWGMPVFRWDVLKEQGYEWWINRIQKNMELFDVLRLDHFRAFSTYWEVPAGEETAKNGQWIQGPASEFFQALEAKLGKLPFVAEDLGDIDQPVYDLRDEFEFPGMKVLQFAFGDNMPESIDIPHNYNPNFFCYTGTHDNNTTVGWFHTEAGKTERKNLEEYTGESVDDKNVHKLLAKLGYASVAKTVILPMQDLLGLDESARMNTPSSAENNWAWRLDPQLLKDANLKWIPKWVKLYNRE